MAFTVDRPPGRDCFVFKSLVSTLTSNNVYVRISQIVEVRPCGEAILS